MLTLEAALPGLRAKEALEQNGHDAYDPKVLYELMLLATGEDKLAADAACARAERIMDEQTAAAHLR